MVEIHSAWCPGRVAALLVAALADDHLYQQVVDTQNVSGTKYWNANYKTLLDLVPQITIIGANNTPPASRKNSAPRGVTRFWRAEK